MNRGCCHHNPALYTIQVQCTTWLLITISTEINPHCFIPGHLTEVPAFLSFMLLSDSSSPFCYLKKQFFFLRIWPEPLHRLPGRSPGRFHPRLCSRSFSRILFGCDLFPVKPHGPHLLNRCPKVQMAGWRWSKAGAVTEATAGSASLGPASAQAPGISGGWHPRRV